MIYGAQPTGIMATMPMPAQAAMGQFAITDPDSPMGIESLAGGQEDLAQRLQAMGVPQYGLGSFFRKVVPKEFRKAASFIIPFLPVDPFTKAMLSAGLTKLEGGSTKDALFSAGTSILANQLPGKGGSFKNAVGQAALNAGAAKARGMDTDDALRAGLKSGVASMVVPKLAKTEIGQQITGGINTLADTLTPDFLKKSIGDVNEFFETERVKDPSILDGSGVPSVDTPTADAASVQDFNVANIAEDMQNILDIGDEITTADLQQTANMDAALNLSQTDATVSITDKLNEIVEATGTSGANVPDSTIDDAIIAATQQSESLPPPLPRPEESVFDRFRKGLTDTVRGIPEGLEKVKDNIVSDLTLSGTKADGTPLDTYEKFENFATTGIVLPMTIYSMLKDQGMSEEELEGLSDEQIQTIMDIYNRGVPTEEQRARSQQIAEFYADRAGINRGGITAVKEGGEIVGPGTGTSDSVPALLSDGEFVMTAKSVRNAGGGDREKGAAKMYALMSKLEKGAA
jgi:hypothetical protein